MKRSSHAVFTATTLVWLSVTASLAAQQAADNAAADPFAQPAKPAADPFAPPPKAAAPKAAAADAAGPGLAVTERDPVVLAIRDRNPTTPDELMFAVKSLFDIDRPEVAKFYLTRLIAAQPDRDQLEAFHREYGTGFFLRMAREPRMQPEAAQFAKSVRDAAYEAARDPRRLAALVPQLSDPSPSIRARAIADLERAGDAAATPLLQALADDQLRAAHPWIRTALVELGQPMFGPVLGALESPDEGLRVQAIHTLAGFGSTRAIPFLVGPALDPSVPEATRQAAALALVQLVGSEPSRVEAVTYLFRRVREHLNGVAVGRVNHLDQTVLWHWDAATRSCVPRTYEAADASRLMAARLSQDLFKLDPQNRDARRLYLVANLIQAKIEGGLDRPLPQGDGTLAAQAKQVGVAAIEDALAYAIQNDYPAAAIGAAELLGELGEATLVYSMDGQPRPLVQALRHSNRRLRLAAADAIMRLDPDRPYPGSSYLLETFCYFVRTVGSRRALVAMPRIEKGQTLVGVLNEIGLSADVAETGREAFRMAINNPDYEFLLISDAIESLDANETIQMFRKDPLTAGLPIGLMARRENQRRAEEIAELDPLLLAFPLPHDVQSMSFQASRLKDLAGLWRVDYDGRLDQAGRAMQHLIRLVEAQPPRTFYDLFRVRPAAMAALDTPQLSTSASQILGLLGCPECQRSLVSLASQHGRPLDQRQAAATAFAQAVQRRGVLLTRDEILQQYERYNRSETLDVSTQQVLGNILDAIEEPSRDSGAHEGLTTNRAVASPQPN